MSATHSVASDSSLRVARFSGQALEAYIGDLARLRIQVFREFPYLYDGSMAYEEKYLRTYQACPDAVVVVVFDGDRVVGASTGIPLAQEVEDFQRPFREQGYDPRRIFYCAESVLDADYRGRGLGVRFFAEREAHARALGDFDYFTFCAVQRPEDHALRPRDYQPLDPFWRKRGYHKAGDLSTRFSWKDVDGEHETSKVMEFWLKSAKRPTAD